MNKYLLTFLVISFVSVFFFGTYVGLYKIFPYEILDSSKDVLFEQKSIQNNQFVNQANVDSLIKIHTKPNIDQKRNFLINHFWNVGSGTFKLMPSQLPEVESDISDSR